MFAKPATSNLSPSVVSTILCGLPAHAVEHLVHAWDALASAAFADQSINARNLAYVQSRIDCIESEPVQRGIRPRQRRAITEELAELKTALASAAAYG